MKLSHEEIALSAAPTLCAAPDAHARRLVEALGIRAVVLIGMMGSGKSSVGKRLGGRLGVPFADADAEIELAAGMTIPDIFAERGEAEFRAGEARVIARLLQSGPLVLATGGGAWLDPATRENVGRRGVSVWLRAPLDVLMRRVRKRANRPLLQTADPEATMRALLDQRSPVYALADLTLESRDAPHEAVVEEALATLGRHLGLEP